MKTEPEIKEMLRKLEELRESMPEHSAFGSNNWEVIYAQKSTLEWVLGNLEDDDIL